jgi:hypothetical protein
MVALCLAATRALGQDSFIYINISVKVILNPADGLWPRSTDTDPATRLSPGSISPAVADANAFLAAYHRGYRLRIIETLPLGGIGQDQSRPATEPGFYAVYDDNRVYGYDSSGNPLKLIDALDRVARTNATTKATFKWNDQAANLFVPSNWGGGGGIDPANGNALGFGFFDGWLLLHELGHYYSLIHTFEADMIDDTLIDPNSVNEDAIAYQNYGVATYDLLNAAQKAAVDAIYYPRAQDSIAAANSLPPYAQLSAADKENVDNALYNLMSYNDPYHRNPLVTRLTEGQLDRWTDAANALRSETISGRTVYLSPTGNDSSTGGDHLNPKLTIASAVASTSPTGSDIVLALPGTYNTPTITHPVTIRATRKGPVTLIHP